MSDSDDRAVYVPSFIGALSTLKDGFSVCRTGWNGHHKLTLQVPDENSKMTQPYIYDNRARCCGAMGRIAD
jgi:hypothetical protein